MSELLASLGICHRTSNPSCRIRRGSFEGLPDVSAGPSCDSAQITPEMRARRPLLNRLCTK